MSDFNRQNTEVKIEIIWKNIKFVKIYWYTSIYQLQLRKHCDHLICRHDQSLETTSKLLASRNRRHSLESFLFCSKRFHTTRNVTSRGAVALERLRQWLPFFPSPQRPRWLFCWNFKTSLRFFLLRKCHFERRTAFHLAMFEGLCWEPSSYKIHSKSHSQMLQLAKILKTSDIAAVVVKLTAQIALKSLVMQNGVIPMTFTSFQRWKGTAATMWQLLATQSAKVQKCKLKFKKKNVTVKYFQASLATSSHVLWHPYPTRSYAKLLDC